MPPRNAKTLTPGIHRANQDAPMRWEQRGSAEKGRSGDCDFFSLGSDDKAEFSEAFHLTSTLHLCFCNAQQGSAVRPDSRVQCHLFAN